MTESKKPEVGDRVRVVKDVATADGRVYLYEGAVGIVEMIDEDSPPIAVAFKEREEWVDFEDIEVVAPAEEVAQESVNYAITAKITVEVEITVEGQSRQEAIEYFEANALDYLNDFETMELKKTKVVSAFQEDDLG